MEMLYFPRFELLVTSDLAAMLISLGAVRKTVTWFQGG